MITPGLLLRETASYTSPCSVLQICECRLLQAVTSINVLLDKADHQYKLLQERKSALEHLLVCISDHSSDSSVSSPPTQSAGVSLGGSAPSSSASSTSAINKNIQMLAQKYCSDCRNAFEELSKIIQVWTVQSSPFVINSVSLYLWLRVESVVLDLKVVWDLINAVQVKDSAC